MNAVLVKEGSSRLIPIPGRDSAIGLIESVGEGTAAFEAAWETMDGRLGVAAATSNETSTSIGLDPVGRDDVAPFGKFEAGIRLPWRSVADCST